MSSSLPCMVLWILELNIAPQWILAGLDEKIYYVLFVKHSIMCVHSLSSDY